MKIVRLMCLVLLLLLTSCGALSQRPPKQAVKLAITQQLTNIQQSIAEELRFSEGGKISAKPNFKVGKVTVQSREKVSDRDFVMRRYNRQDIAELYRVRGTFDATITDAAAKKNPQEGPFDVYLGTTEAADATAAEGIETWFLIRP